MMKYLCFYRHTALPNLTGLSLSLTGGVVVAPAPISSTPTSLQETPEAKATTAPITLAPPSPEVVSGTNTTPVPVASDDHSTQQQLPAEAPPDVLALIRQEQDLTSQCRAGSGDDPKTQQACDARNKLVEDLKTRGWCYGRAGDAGYQRV